MRKYYTLRLKNKQLIIFLFICLLLVISVKKYISHRKAEQFFDSYIQTFISDVDCGIFDEEYKKMVKKEAK